MTTPHPVPGNRPARIALQQVGGLDAAERHGMRLWGRVLLVVLAEGLLAAWIGLGAAEEGMFPLGYLLVPCALVLGLLVTTQAHHRLPVAWHVVVVLVGFAASVAVLPWSREVLFGDTFDTFSHVYWVGLGWASIVVVQLGCLLALFRPAGSSYVTRQKIAQSQQPQQPG